MHNCPYCNKQVSLWEKLNSGNCKECKEKILLDPYRSNIAAFIAFLGVILIIKSFWFLIIGIIVEYYLLSSWVPLVRKECFDKRKNKIELILMIMSAVGFGFLAIYLPLAEIPLPRWVFISTMLGLFLLSLIVIRLKIKKCFK